MKKLLFILIIAALAAVSGALWMIFFFKSEEHKVKLVLDKLVYLAERPASPGAAELAVKLGSIDDIFAGEVSLDFGRRVLSGTYSSRSIEPLLVQYRKVFARAAVEMDDLTVTVAGDTAEAVFSCRLTGKLHRGDLIEEVRDVGCRLKKIEDKWRIVKLEINEVLER
jgi:hypothetical protein